MAAPQNKLRFPESLAAEGHVVHTVQWDENASTDSGSCHSGSRMELLLYSSRRGAESLLWEVVGEGAGS